jgi:hypothetical protein
MEAKKRKRNSQRRQAPFVEWVREHRIAITLAAAALVLRVVYVYFLTDYSNYLFGDMGGYWNRAYHRYTGRVYGESEFNMWPVAYHMTLAWGLRLADFLGFAKLKLEFILFLQILAQAISIGMFYEIARTVLRCRRRALMSAGVYALFYQLVYLNAFVLSEHGAIPFFIASIWLCFMRTEVPAAHAVAGLLSAIAAGWSPRFGPYALALAAYLLFHPRAPQPRIKRLIYPAFYALGIAFFVFLSYTVSGGKVRGLGLGGHAFLIAQCKVDVVESRQGDAVWVFVPPTFVPISQRKTFRTHVPFYDQGYWYKEGVKCIKENPKTLIDGIWLQHRLFFGPIFPHVNTAWGYGVFMAISSLLTIIFFLAGMFVAPFLWKKRRDPMRFELWCLWSLPVLTSVLTYFFTVERRYMFPMLFVITLLAFSIIPAKSSKS